jgi:8-oxo-dGTP pyrophosphatase MutT (NUDIX family)
MKVLGPIPKDERTHRYCPTCWSDRIVPVDVKGREFYRCEACGYSDSRLVEIYPGLRYDLMEKQEILHYSVGAIICWEGKYLLFRRRLYPFAYTIVAGHWDLTDPSPEVAIAREIREECGLQVGPPGEPMVDRLHESCRRGADHHEWRLFQFGVESNRATLSEEADIMGWYDRDEIRSLDLTIPTRHFLAKLGIIEG